MSRLNILDHARADQMLRVLFLSLEVYPLAKVGGLADVAYALPKALRKLGCDIRIAMPKYEWIKGKEEIGNIYVPFRGHEKVSVELTSVNGVPVYLLGSDFFLGETIYEVVDKKKETIKFSFYSRAVIELLKSLDFKPDVIHCNDWHNALVPVYLSLLKNENPEFRKIATVFTIHNLLHQGTRSVDRSLTLEDLGLSKKASGILEGGQVNPMKGGILYSDIVNTVSETYAKEIRTKEYGCGLDPYLRKRKIYGIVNGIDYDVWNPSKDQFIYKKYGTDHLEGKLENKRSLLEEVDLPADLAKPLLGMVCRLATQKGLDLVGDVLPKFLSKKKLTFILLGMGNPEYHKLFGEISERFRNIKVFFRFDEKLAHKIYAGSDIFLVPSRFEPCGLSQLICLKYGTIPIVRKTGGLADTIIDFDKSGRRGNGFVFSKPTSTAFEYTLRRALATFEMKELWEKLVKRAMSADYSWDYSAKKYLELYRKALEEVAKASRTRKKEVGSA